MHSKATVFEKKKKARTFLITNDDSDILAYYTLSLKSLILPETMSNSQKKKLDGLYTNISNNVISTYLIAQFAKNDYFAENINGDEIMKFALQSIYTAQEQVAGRIVLVELADETHLIDFYKKFDFVYIEKSSSSENSLIQMIKIIS